MRRLERDREIAARVFRDLAVTRQEQARRECKEPLEARDVVAAAAAREHVGERAAGEGGAAREEQPVRVLVQADRARGVPGSVEDTQRQPAGVYEASVVQLELRFSRGRCVGAADPRRSRHARKI